MGRRRLRSLVLCARHRRLGARRARAGHGGRGDPGARRRLCRVPPELPARDIAARFPDHPGAASAGFFARRRSDARARVRVAGPRAARGQDARADRHAPREAGAVADELEPGLRPLMVTTLGRTGSTSPVRCLPRTRRSPPTARSSTSRASRATGWASCAASLTPLATGASWRHRAPSTGTGGSGTQPPFPRRIRDAALEWLGRRSVEALASFCQGGSTPSMKAGRTAHGARRRRILRGEVQGRISCRASSGSCGPGA